MVAIPAIKDGLFLRYWVLSVLDGMGSACDGFHVWREG